MLDELADKIDTLSNNVDSLRITAQALLQVAAQHQQEMDIVKQRQAESDERFNILLEEVRYLIRRDDRRDIS